ncbi:MAG: adenosylhomocysteinase [Acidimicrobiales bacterium]
MDSLQPCIRVQPRCSRAMSEERRVAEGRIAWTRRHMPVLVETITEFTTKTPFRGLTVGFRLHLEPKTAVLIEALLAGGAQVIAMGNEGTTQFGTVEVLSGQGCEVLDRPGQGPEATAANLSRIASTGPDLVLDNGAELIGACLDTARPPRGATEETTSGAFRLREDHAGLVRFPVIVINDSPLKSIVENKHGVGESVVDTIVRVTNMSFHKKQVVVYGYGWCGRGIALYAQRRGADVTVVEIDPIKALEAAMDGFDVADPSWTPAIADVVITATGRADVVDYTTIEQLPDGVVLANAGHVDTEIDISHLEQQAPGIELAPSLKRHDLPNGRSVFCVAEGRIVNLAAHGGIGNPIEAMDLGLTLQARSFAALIDPAYDLGPGPQAVPDAVNNLVATAVLHSMGQLGQDSP